MLNKTILMKSNYTARFPSDCPLSVPRDRQQGEGAAAVNMTALTDYRISN